MKRNYNKQDKIKWIVTSVAFVLAFVMIAGIFMQLFAKNEKYKPSTWFSKACVKHEYNEEDKCIKCGKDKPVEEEKNEEGAVITEGESHGMRLMSARLVSGEVANNNIESRGNNQFVLTATITPQNAENQKVIWSIAWVNPESTWVKSHNNPVTNYVSISSLNTETTTLSITVTCKYAFSEQIKITCTSAANSSIKATCKVDYYRRVLGVRGGIFDGTNSTKTWDLKTNSYISVPQEVIWSDGTIGDSLYQIEYYLTASTQLRNAYNGAYSTYLNKTYNYSDKIYFNTFFYVNEPLNGFRDPFDGIFKYCLDEVDYGEAEINNNMYNTLKTNLAACSEDLVLQVIVTTTNYGNYYFDYGINFVDSSLSVLLTSIRLSSTSHTF